ncbi:TPA: DUF1902 domain-containing protein [Morganella morganii]
MDRLVYVANFGDRSVRFVAVGGELYVSRSDITDAVHDCATDYVKPIVRTIIDDWFANFSLDSDKTGAILSDRSIGPVVHFHSAGNLLDSLSGFNGNINQELIESGRRIHTFFRWFSDASYDANVHFGITILDMFSSVKNRLDALNPALTVTVTHADMWIAECDALGLVTEAETYDDLTNRVWEIAPELYEMNGLGSSEDDIRINFIQSQSLESRMAL